MSAGRTAASFSTATGRCSCRSSELQALSDKLVEAQPLIGTLARDPSLRGLFDTLALFVNGAEKEQDYAAIARLDPTLTAVADAVQAVLEGRHQPVSWQRLMTGLSNDRRELRRFVLTRPVLDFDALDSGAARARRDPPASRATFSLDPAARGAAADDGAGPLNDEQFATLREGRSIDRPVVRPGLVLLLGGGAVAASWSAPSSRRCSAGLVLTAGFAALAIGSLNLISVAFGVLFIGLGVDFGIQFSMRYRDQRHRRGSLPAALAARRDASARRSCWPPARPLSGFCVRPDQLYRNSRAGMDRRFRHARRRRAEFVLLPALIALVRPRGEAAAVGFRWAAPIDRLLLRRRRWVLVGAGVLAAVSLALLPFVRFDFDPLDLKIPKPIGDDGADLMRGSDDDAYTAEISPSLREAEALAGRIASCRRFRRPSRRQASSQTDQDPKLAILGDLRCCSGRP